MTLEYINKTLQISFDVSYEDIAEGDYCLIYDVSSPSAPIYKVKALQALQSETRYNTIYNEPENPSTENPSDNPSEENPSDNLDNYTYEPYTFYWYTFSAEIKIEESGTYSYEAIFYDSIDNEGDTQNLGSIEVCLTPETPDALNFDSINFSSLIDDDVSSVESYYTIYHYPVDDPSDITTDGNFYYDTTTFYLNIPSDGTYSYYRTVTGISGSCETESEASEVLQVVVSGGIVYQLPYSDVTALSTLPTTGGKLNIYFKYPYGYTNEALPEIFNIYYSVDPSGEFTLDGSTNFVANTSKFGQFVYTTSNSFTHNTEVYIKVLPAIQIGSSIYEKESDTYTSAVADNAGPTVTISNITFVAE